MTNNRGNLEAHPVNMELITCTEDRKENRDTAQFDCINFMNLLGDYVDGELSPTDSRTCHSHMQECEYCKKLVGEYQETIRLAGELKESAPPLDVQLRLRSALRSKLGL